MQLASELTHIVLNAGTLISHFSSDVALKKIYSQLILLSSQLKIWLAFWDNVQAYLSVLLCYSATFLTVTAGQCFSYLLLPSKSLQTLWHQTTTFFITLIDSVGQESRPETEETVHLCFKVSETQLGRLRQWGVTWIADGWDYLETSSHIPGAWSGVPQMLGLAGTLNQNKWMWLSMCLSFLRAQWPRGHCTTYMAAWDRKSRCSSSKRQMLGGILWPRFRSHIALLSLCFIDQGSHKPAQIEGWGLRLHPLTGGMFKNL